MESALILLVFLASLIGALDFGQLLYKHQLMVERVRAGVRYGLVTAWDGTGDQIANVVLYNTPTPSGGQSAFLGMTRANVSVVRTPPSANDPNDERITVSIVNYNFQFLSPWIARTYTGNYAVVQSTPLVNKP